MSGKFVIKLFDDNGETLVTYRGSNTETIAALLDVGANTRVGVAYSQGGK